MKQSTQDRIEEVVDIVLNDGSSSRLEAIVEKILREQDRDTRHACAEAVAFSTVAPASAKVNEAINRAYQAVLNTQAV